MNRPKVSMIILTHNGWEMLEECLKNVLLQDYPEIEIIVVDYSSDEGTPNNLNQTHPDIPVLALEKNQGYGGAANAGVDHTQGEYVALVTNDVYLPINFISNLVKALEADQRAAIVCPGVYNLKLNTAHYPYVDGISLSGTIISHVFKNTTFCFGPVGCPFMFRRSMIQRPFDADYGFYFADTYLAWKARLQGYTVLRLPETIVKHIQSSIVNETNEEDRFFIKRNRRLSYLTFFSEKTRRRIGPLIQLARWMERRADRRHGRSRLPVRRANGWIKDNRKLIRKKYVGLQALRKVEDQEIYARMSYKITNDNSLVGRLVNRLAWYWCRLNGLKTWEMLENK